MTYLQKKKIRIHQDEKLQNLVDINFCLLILDFERISILLSDFFHYFWRNVVFLVRPQCVQKLNISQHLAMIRVMRIMPDD